jgi:hypothetical protein
MNIDNSIILQFFTDDINIIKIDIFYDVMMLITYNIPNHTLIYYKSILVTEYDDEFNKQRKLKIQKITNDEY